MIETEGLTNQLGGRAVVELRKMVTLAPATGGRSPPSRLENAGKEKPAISGGF